MYYIYILHSSAADTFYKIGSTSNPEGRLIAHNHPKNKSWTNRFQPWEMIYSEVFETKEAALAII
jgi:predicted GIY-YIG superfamily endonuclease